MAGGQVADCLRLRPGTADYVGPASCARIGVTTRPRGWRHVRTARGSGRSAMVVAGYESSQWLWLRAAREKHAGLKSSTSEQGIECARWPSPGIRRGLRAIAANDAGARPGPVFGRLIVGTKPRSGARSPHSAASSRNRCCASRTRFLGKSITIAGRARSRWRVVPDFTLSVKSECLVVS